MSELLGDCFCYGFHLFCLKVKMLLAEIHVAFLLHWDEMDVRMRHLKAHDAYTYLDAWNGLLDGCSHTLCEYHVSRDKLIVLVEQIVDLLLRDHECMPLCHRIDVEKRIEPFVFCYFVAWYLTSYNT